MFLDPVPRGYNLIYYPFNVNEKSPRKNWKMVIFQAQN